MQADGRFVQQYSTDQRAAERRGEVDALCFATGGVDDSRSSVR